MRAIPASRFTALSVATTLVSSLILLALLSPVAFGQEAAQFTGATPLITRAVDESQLTVLRGNVHPLAKPQFDLGAAPASMPLQRMLLVLKRSPEQEFALRSLMDEQQDKTSPNYHKWLTPEAYGRQFGPTDYDMQVITGWLQSHGFQVGTTKGRSVLEFSGSASQVQEAFHTTIHKYIVNGEQHWANDRDPAIPSALTPAVAGIDSLNNFGRKPQNRVLGTARREKATGRITPSTTTEFTFAPGGANPCNAGDNNCYFVGPYDFATIYNVAPQWTAGIDGTGQRIGIVQETNITLADAQQFRSMFGLPANDPKIVLNGPDPGIFAPGSGSESEADIDVEWSGAVATGATVDLVVSAPTDTTQGVDLSALYIVENNSDDVMSESFGLCEAFLGNGGNSFYYGLWEQAAAQGISVFVSSGDQAAAGCDFQGQPAVNGLAVNGIASTPFNVAVGGTDFQDVFNPANYWNLTNDVHQASAKGYIPETTWNNTCTNSLWAQFGFSSNAETRCNDKSMPGFTFSTDGGSGGASNCSTSTNNGVSIVCQSGTPKPNWQTGAGVPADLARDLPDASLFAANGLQGNIYMFCQSDITSGSSCDLSDPFATIGIAGGTSFGAPAMAGIMALVNQKIGGRQGNPNYAFYKLAAQTPASNCNSTTGPNSACIFNDVTDGTIRTPCQTSSPDCTTSVAGHPNGILNGYDTTTAFDLATGLGTMNVNNLVNQWHTAVVKASTTSLVLNSGTAVNKPHGSSISVQITAAHTTGGSGTPTGDVSLIAMTGPNPPLHETGVDFFPLTSGSTSGASTTLLPGGTYAVKARYGGDSTFLGSDSSTVNVTITPENSSTTLICDPQGTVFSNCAITLDANSNYTALSGGGSITYGNLVYLHALVAPASGATTYGIPTGSITFNDNPAIPGTYTLNSEGSAVTPAGIFNLPVGAHSIAGVYSSDPSYNASTSPALAFTVTQAASSVSVTPNSNSIPSGGSVTLTANLTLGTSGLASYGNGPTGTVTFSDTFNGSTVTLGSPTVSGTAGSGNIITSSGTPAAGSASFTTAAGALADGQHSITAVYNGDTNYQASPASGSVLVQVGAPPDFTLPSGGLGTVTVTAGGQGTVNLSITANNGFNAAVNFTCVAASLPAETTCSTGTIAAGSTTGTMTVQTTGPHQIAFAGTHGQSFVAWVAMSGGLAFGGIFLVGGRRRRSWTAFMSLIVLALLIMLPACGGGSGTHTDPGTPKGTYTVNVTATSGSLSHNTSFQLTVQ